MYNDLVSQHQHGSGGGNYAYLVVDAMRAPGLIGEEVTGGIVGLDVVGGVTTGMFVGCVVVLHTISA